MITLIQLSMRFGGKILFKDVSLQFNTGNRYGLIGANGCGKSTLIKIIIGEVTAESGEVIFPQQEILGSLSQDQYAFRNQLILDVVLQGRKKLWEAMEKKKKLLENEGVDGFDEKACQALMNFEKIIEEQEGYAADGQAAKLLEGLGIREEWHKKPLEFLSGGYRLRVLLAQVLFGKPSILVLDEPTNHLDLYSIKWLEDHLRNFQGTLLVTSHDRHFLNAICTHIADVDYGTIKIYKGNYEEFEKQKRIDRELKESMLEKSDKRRSDLQGFIDRFGAKATKARQAQSKARLVEKLEDEIEALNLIPSTRLYPKLKFEPLRASGIAALTIQQISKAYGPKKVLNQVSFKIERGEKVAVIGPNGIGKSTLLEILTGHQLCDHGEFEWGFAAIPAYFPQDHAREVKGSHTLLEWLSQFDREIPEQRLREFLGRVLFSGDTVNQPLDTLSGGETARLLLAKMMLQKPNVLVFDEPTNHLDMEAIAELTKALQTYEGTLLLVSHNRHFVSQLADRVIEITYEGVQDFKGSYEEYLEKQNHDFLASKLPLSQRYTYEPGASKSAPSQNNYADHKRLKSLQTQLRKKVALAEEACHVLEEKIKRLNEQMATHSFYEKTPREKQQLLVQEKLELENQLLAAFEHWEKTGIELENSVKEFS